MKTDTQQNILQYLLTNGAKGPTEIASNLGVSTQMAHRHLNKLVGQGKVLKIGEPPFVVYKASGEYSVDSNLNLGKYYQYEISPKITDLLLIVND